MSPVIPQQHQQQSSDDVAYRGQSTMPSYDGVWVVYGSSCSREETGRLKTLTFNLIPEIYLLTQSISPAPSTIPPPVPLEWKLPAGETF